MDELNLYIESIENKVKKLLLKQKKLTDKINQIESDNFKKDNLIKEKDKRIEELENKIELVSAAKTLNNEDNDVLKHRINEILREIDNCLILLNK